MLGFKWVIKHSLLLIRSKFSWEVNNIMSSSSRHLPCSQSSLKIPCRKHDSLITVTSCWTWSNVKFTPSKIKKKTSKYKFTNLSQEIAHFPLFVKWWKIPRQVSYASHLSWTPSIINWLGGGGGPNLTLYQHLRTLVVFWLQKRLGFPLQRGRGERAII